MVTVNLNKQGINGHILLEPNLSLNWKGNMNIFIIFSVFTLAVAFYFTINDKWLVLPLSGLELIALFFALYIFFSRNKNCEVIRFTIDTVTIERGKNKIESSQQYQRIWSKFYVNKTDSQSMPQIFIRSHDKETEIGVFLNYEDKQKVISALKEITIAFQHQVCEK